MKIKKLKLKNKLNVLLMHTPGETSGSCQFWFRAGSALEEKNEEGIAHFLEHMFFKGTAKRPNNEISAAVEDFGGEINAFTSFDYTCYYINAPHTNLEESIDILLDMVANPLFKQEDIVPEREVVFEEYLRGLDSPGSFEFQELCQKVFTNKYGHSIVGREQTIKNFSREQLESFRKRYYNCANSLLIISGDLKNEKKILKLIESYKLPLGQKSQFPQFSLKSKTTPRVYSKEVRQAMVNLVIECPSFDGPQAPAEDLALNILFNGETSYLHHRLVIDDTTVSGVSGTSMFFAQGGLHLIRLLLPPENLSKAKDKLINALEELFQEGVKDHDIEKIKNQYIASKLYERETIESLAFSKGHGFAQNGNTEADEEFIERIKSCTKEEINRALKNIFSRTIHISIQLPKNHHKANKQLGTSWQIALKKLSAQQKQKKTTKEKIQKSKFDSRTQVIELAPQVKLLYRQGKEPPTFVFHGYMRGGLAFETPKNNGLYNLLQSQLPKGYEGCAFEELKKDLENKSASLHGFAGKNAYGLTLHGQSDHFEVLMKHYFGSLLSPLFEERWIEQEKELLQRELENHEEDPTRIAFKTFSQEMFKGHPYAMPIIGNKTTTKSFTRKQLQDTHRQQLYKHELLFCYCGDKPLKEVESLLRPYLKDLVAAKRTKALGKKCLEHSKNKKYFIELDRLQTHIVMGKAAYSMDHKEDLMLKMLSSHLSGMSSDLFTLVRDQLGLCYAIQSLHFSAKDGGYFGIYIGTSNDKRELAIQAISELLKELANKGLSSKEFNKLKRSIKGQNLLNLQTNGDYASTYSVPLYNGLGLDYFHESNQKMDKLKREDFNAFIKKYLDNKWLIVSVGKKAP